MELSEEQMETLSKNLYRHIEAQEEEEAQKEFRETSEVEVPAPVPAPARIKTLEAEKEKVQTAVDISEEQMENLSRSLYRHMIRKDNQEDSQEKVRTARIEDRKKDSPSLSLTPQDACAYLRYGTRCNSMEFSEEQMETLSRNLYRHIEAQ